MATLRPFHALRPVRGRAEEIASVPYDVVSSVEARKLAEGLDLSFLHVIRPEIDLPPQTDEHADEVYATGARNLRAYEAAPASTQENEPALYAYRLIMNGRAQIGVFGCVSVADYDNGFIVKHENTRPAKEADRTRHIVEQRAHAEPVMLTFPDDRKVEAALRSAESTETLYDFTARDGVQHTIWRVPQTAQTALVSAFAEIPHIYVADGHHRCAAASRAAREVGAGPGDEASYFPAVLFPMSQLAILPYNRIVRELPATPAAFLEAVTARCAVSDGADPSPPGKGHVSMYLAGRWVDVALPQSAADDPASRMDVARLGEHILEPLLGIADVRSDPNIGFVGGIRGTDELQRLVDAGEAAIAFSMAATDISELVAVSDAGLLMPPKSTWFEPKLRSGLLVHLF